MKMLLMDMMRERFNETQMEIRSSVISITDARNMSAIVTVSMY